MKFVCAPSFINTTLKTSYLLTTYSFKAGWCNGEGTRLPVMWPGVQILASTPYVGWSLLLVLSFTVRGFFPVHLVFPNTSKFQFVLERTDTFERILKNS